ncbi:MAG: hypothetical protein IPP74_11415 [Alphaproteobacteria bacterium]|nr:hypothetical protein [Alphaproteobacteria bacterium]
MPQRSISLLVISCLISSSWPAFGYEETDKNKNEAVETNNFSEDDLLILFITLDGTPIKQMIDAYQRGPDFMIPLGALAEALDFPIKVNAKEGKAEGWFIKEDKTLLLDINASQITVAGHRFPLQKADTITKEDEIYIDSKKLDEWLGIPAEVKLSDVMLDLKPKEKLPLQLKMQRILKANNERARPSAEQVFDRLPEPYKPYDVPFIDLNLSGQYAKTATPEFSHNYSILSQGDLAYMTSRFFVAGDEKKTPSAVNFNLSKVDLDGNMLGFMKAKQVSVGDINAVNHHLVSSSTEGVGFQISNIEPQRSFQFDTKDFIGQIQPGWDVELYRNDQLIDLQTSGPDGRYEFRNVELVFGTNDFRLLFYGPQGEIREERSSYTIDETIIAKGSFDYDLSVDKKSQSLFNINERGQTLTHDNSVRSVFSGAYGLTENITGTFGFAQLPIDNTTNVSNYLTTGMRTSLGGWLTNATAAWDAENHGYAADLTTHTSIKNVNIRAGHKITDNYLSETERDRDLKSSSDLLLTGTLNPKSSHAVQYSLNGRYNRYDERNELRLSNRLSTLYSGLLFSHNIEYDKIDKSDLTFGEASVRGIYNRYVIRSAANYDLKPEKRFKELSLGLDRNLNNDLIMQSSIHKQFVDEKATSFDGSLTRIFDHYRLSTSFQVDDQGGVGVGVSLSLGIGRDPRSNKWNFSGRPFASTGAVSAAAYLDNNYNSTYDAGDEWLEDVDFDIRGRAKSVSDSESGSKNKFVTELPPGRITNAAINSSSLPDPYLVPTKTGYGVLPRPGHVTILDYPVIATGEIEGTIYKEKDGGILKELGGVEIELLDTEGKLAYETVSDFDGAYLFSKVKPGTYRLSIKQEYLSLKKLTFSAIDDIQLTREKDSITGIDIHLVPEAVAKEVSATVDNNNIVYHQAVPTDEGPLTQ